MSGTPLETKVSREAVSAATHLSVAMPSDYIQLLKPRVMSLVVFTGLTGLAVAPTHLNPWLSAVAVFAIAIGAGSAGALNMALEGPTDALMRRTMKRPVASGKISRTDALSFGGVLAVLSVFTLWLSIGWVAAGLLAITIAYYVGFYTLFLKRRTPQNIVIGGAAGALPPVIGWAAATGEAYSSQAWILFLIIFLWTPPHSWALALYTHEDYKSAGIPMMPVAKGAKHTRLLILIYSLVLVPVAMMPYVTRLGGIVYGLVAGLGGLGFLALALKLFLSKAGDHPEGGENSLYDVKTEAMAARNLFAFSILWLTGLFGTLLLEHLLRG